MNDVHDLALALAGLKAAPTAPVTYRVGTLEHELIWLPAGAQHEAVARATGTALLLEGMATVQVDDWRATLAGGCLVAVPQDAKLTVSADAAQGVALLWIRQVTLPSAELPAPDAPAAATKFT